MSIYAGSPFEDDFDSVPATQPSGTMTIVDKPQLTQQNPFYDVVDDDDEFELFAGDRQSGTAARASQHSRPTQSTAARSSKAPLPTSSQSPFSLLRGILSIRPMIIVLVVILALGSGVAFAREMISHQSQGGQPAMQMGVAMTQPGNQPVPTSVVTVKNTPGTTTQNNGQATSTGTSTTGMPGAMGQTQLPAEWVASGRGTTDMLEALSVAETFTQRYQTLDFRSPGTLSASRFILTEAANDRFEADKRDTQAFAQQIQQQQLIQAALITEAHLTSAKTSQGKFFAWVTVSYQLAMQHGKGSTPIASNQKMNVLLVEAPFDAPRGAPPMGGIGWLVSSYQIDSTVQPDIPAQP